MNKPTRRMLISLTLLATIIVVILVGNHIQKSHEQEQEQSMIYIEDEGWESHE